VTVNAARELALHLRVQLALHVGDDFFAGSV
jgi:hypothetical protein